MSNMGRLRTWIDLVPDDRQPAGVKTPEEIARMTNAERLDYSRSFDQSKMPAWRDPRVESGK
jgi:hypothetical protein